ncbi:hypothetical protein HPOK310_1246 [Helicobacter pylori OK310]|uniref:hypothetical protein n=1 Tax=Helicobacter pylori TaxID=210 RepID=UPI0002C0D5C8|nr:hypothetical protein [Helicobacter pylori]BAM98674.1 hypothetical protein HPOK310_1246 [Helicobacter pylori OK310]
MRVKKYSPMPKRYKFLQIVNEAEAVRLARQNMPRFRVKDNFFSGGDGGVRGYSSIGSRIEAIYSNYRIPHTARITFSLDEIERWEKEHLEQGLGNSFKPKKKKTKARRKAKRKK